MTCLTHLMVAFSSLQHCSVNELLAIWLFCLMNTVGLLPEAQLAPASLKSLASLPQTPVPLSSKTCLYSYSFPPKQVPPQNLLQLRKPPGAAVFGQKMSMMLLTPHCEQTAPATTVDSFHHRYIQSGSTAKDSVPWEQTRHPSAVLLTFKISTGEEEKELGLVTSA